MNNVILWYIYNYYIYICVQNRDEHFTHNNHLDISSWYPHYGWLLLVKFSLLFLNTSDRYRKISHCILYLHYITTIYIYILPVFFLTPGPPFLFIGQEPTLWWCKDRFCQLKIDARLQWFCCSKPHFFWLKGQQLSVATIFLLESHFSHFFLAKSWKSPKFRRFCFRCIFCRQTATLGLTQLEMDQAGNSEKLLGQFMDVLLVINGDISFFWLVLGPYSEMEL